jgi:hypothetical protein
MSDTTEDPVLLHLRQRKAQLQREQLAIDGRIAEVSDLILKLEDGRSSVNRKRRANSAPPATQPGPYDDSVSLDEVRGILRAQADGPPPEQAMAADGAAP